VHVGTVVIRIVKMEKLIIPQEMLRGKDKITIKFVNCSEQGCFKLYGLLRIKRVR
jgi:hypothetical protein